MGAFFNAIYNYVPTNKDFPHITFRPVGVFMNSKRVTFRPVGVFVDKYVPQ